MRRLWLPALAGLALLCGPAFVAAEEESTGCHGTAVQFVDSPSEAARLAKKQQKLVMVLHISGHFEDPNLT
ncbi:MAG: hypothetical protein KatS3mg105_2508 [Gemmatales bacterium]|nr:MAG: hypothetical protein KatS3mg105_2508 [Gemmatales bacterium]